METDYSKLVQKIDNAELEHPVEEENKVTNFKDIKVKVDTKHVEETQKKPKKSLLARFLNGLVGTRGVKRIFNEITHEIIMPSMRDLFVESIKNGIDMYFYGTVPQRNGRVTSNNSHGNGQKYHNYSGYSQKSNSGVRVYDIGYHCEPVRFLNRGTAISLINELKEDIDEIGFAKVSKFLSITKQKAPDHTITNLGWYDLQGYQIVYEPDPEEGFNYVLYMPDPVMI